MTATSVQEACFSHYLSKGIGPNAAAGMVGVFSYESGLSPVAQNNSGTDAGGVLNADGAIGLAQWNGPRQAALQAYASSKSEDWRALNTQLDFALTECANSYPAVWAAIQANMNIADFVPLFVKGYENPKDPTPEIATALAVAKVLLVSPSAPPAAPAAPPAAPAASGVIASGDAEITALGQLCAILTPFDAAAQMRLVAYLSARF